jgi:signal transduction histidine kinase
MKLRYRSEVARLSRSVAQNRSLLRSADGKGLLPLIPARLADAVIGLGVAVLGAGSAFGARHQGEHVPLAAVAILAAMGLILYPRRRFPAAVLVVMALLVAGLVVLGTSLEGGFVAVLISSYSAAVYGSRRLAFGLAAATVTVLLGLGIPTALGVMSLHTATLVRILLAADGAWLVGLVIRGQFSARSAHLEIMRERAELAVARQQEEARRATIAERLRIARELHDIVAHHLSVVVIQAQGAQRTIGRDPQQAMAAMTQVEQTGRTALEEMRGLLGLLRTGEQTGEEAGDRADADPASGSGLTRLAPPGLADIGALAQQMRAAGLRVIVDTAGEPREVREDVGLTVYRIVQEALTNVVKHAGPARAAVSLTFGDKLEISVTDDGRGAAAGLAADGLPGAGRGTAGMRERVAILNGQLTVGPRPGGGFRVQATIPLEES